MKAQQKGFTLVEIAIVLVIIGLLLGGILKGQEMITQAKIKNVISDFSGISAAYHGYMDRYRAIPGDDPGASRWPAGTVSAAPGNAVISGGYNAAAASPEPESRLFWQHLRLAGFVGGTGANQPFNAVNGLVGVQTGDAAGGPAFGIGGFSSLIICSSNLPDKVSIAADAQMDDGVANAGTVRAVLQSSPNPNIDAASVAASAYAETGTNAYTTCRAL